MADFIDSFMFVVSSNIVELVCVTFVDLQPMRSKLLYTNYVLFYWLQVFCNKIRNKMRGISRITIYVELVKHVFTI